MNINKLREERAPVATELRALVASVEGRNYTSDEDAKYEKLSAAVADYDKKIERAERAAALETETLQAETKPVVTEMRASEEITEKEYRDALIDYVKNDNRFSSTGMSVKTRQTLDKIQKRAQLVSGAANLGANLLIDEWEKEIIQALKDFGGLYTISKVKDTATGAPLHFTTTDFTAQEGEWLTEIQAKTDLDVTFERFTLGAYGLSSKGVRMSYDFLQDEAFNVKDDLLQVCGYRKGVSLSKRLIDGTGSGQLSGILNTTNGATSGGTTAAVAAVTVEELIDFVHSIPTAYRKNQMLCFNDNTLKAIRKFKDTTGNPIWNFGIAGGVPSTILGIPYHIVHELPNMGTGNKFMLIGDFSKYMIRRVKDNHLLKDEFPATRELDFYLHSRWDARLLDRKAVNYLQNA